MSDTRVPLLLVEDESTHAHLIRRAFDTHDFAVDLTVVDTVEAARRSIEQSAPELIITDLLLPDGRGTDLLPTAGTGGFIPVIVMTGFGNEQSAVDSLRAGALDYVVKSKTTLAHMPQVARRVLQQWKVTTERKRAQQLLEVQHALAVSLGSAGNVQETARRLLEATVEIEGIDCGGVYLVGHHKGELNLVAHRGLKSAFVEEISHYRVEAPNTRIVMEGKPLYSHSREFTSTTGEFSSKEGLLAIAMIPVKHEGKVVAAVNLASHTHDEIDLDTRHTLETLVVPIGGVIARARAEEALRESERKYRALVEGSLQGIIVVQGARVRFANSAAVQMAGLRVERKPTLTTKELLTFVPRQDRSALVGRYRDSAVGKAPSPRHESRLVRSDGSVFWVDAFVSSVLFDDRPAMQVAFVDITERKRAENLLAEKTILLDNILQSATDFVVVTTDLDLRVTYFNSTAEQIFGYASDEVVHRTIQELHERANVPPLPLQTTLEKIRRGEERRFTMQRKMEGGLRHLDVRIAGIFDAGGSIAGFALFGQDVTKQRRVAEELAAAKRVAETANRAKSEFLANMSHEIRTPMTAILGFADVLMSLDLSASDRRRHLATIHRNAEGLLTLINDILDLSKIEADRLELEKVGCCVRELVDDIVSLMRLRAEDKNLDLEVDYVLPLPASIQTDPVRLRQILVNLIGNAIKFTEKGHVRVSVRFDPQADKTAPLRFEVADSGMGMSKEEVARLFEPFTQVDASTTRRFGGTGLGLAISQRLARMLGGRIDVASQAGAGSTFTLRVNVGPTTALTLLEAPPDDETKSPDAAKTPPETIVSLSNSTFQGRVLLAEDTEDTQKLVSLVLRNLGLEVDSAYDGEAACQMALASKEEGKPYGLILMDIQMPKRDGHEATRHLRQKGWKEPIVAITAHAMAGDREKCLASGCDAYLAKPLRQEDLLGVLSRFLEAADAPPDSPSATSGDGRSSSGIVGSSHLSEEQRAELLRTFSEGLMERTRQIELALESDDLALLIETAHALKGTAGLFGFDRISDAAHQVEKQGKGTDTGRIRSSTLRLLNLCREAVLDS